MRGRGAVHQADALGALQFPIPFSLPIRLFVEAKNTKAKVGIDVVRNAHGVVHDVNEYSRAAPCHERCVDRDRARVEGADDLRHQVHYRYSLFSTGGFTRDAQSFALAHQISLIDLSGPAWHSYATKLRIASDRALKIPGVRSGFHHVRAVLRDRLASRQTDFTITPDETGMVSPISAWADDLVEALFPSDLGDEIFLGFVEAPFILALRSPDPVSFRRYIASRGRHLNVHIGFDRNDTGGDWTVRDQEDPSAFELSFALPGVLESMLLEAEPEDVVAVARDAKRSLFQTITMYVDGFPVTLRYERIRGGSAFDDQVPEDSSDQSLLRVRSRVSRRADSPMWGSASIVTDRRRAGTGWTMEAAIELIGRLDAEGAIQAKLIRQAVSNGGLISRDEIYTLAGFGPWRTLRGLSRPSSRIRADLVYEGLLAEQAGEPFNPVGAGGQAAAFEVDPEIVRLLRGEVK